MDIENIDEEAKRPETRDVAAEEKPQAEAVCAGPTAMLASTSASLIFPFLRWPCLPFVS